MRGGGRRNSQVKYRILPIERWRFKIGFTLAEVLITLGIIGVVAAMTLPTLIAKYQKQVYTTQLKKVYSELSQAVMLFKVDDNITNLSDSSLNSNAEFNNFIKKYLHVTKECNSALSPCFSNSYKKLSGVESKFNLGCGGNKSYVLTSGVAICARYNNETNALAEIHIDVNGKKAPNVFGRDAFNLFLYSNGIIDDLVTKIQDESNPEGSVVWTNTSAPLSAEQREASFKDGCLSNFSRFYHGCFGKILNDNWEMNY